MSSKEYWLDILNNRLFNNAGSYFYGVDIIKTETLLGDNNEQSGFGFEVDLFVIVEGMHKELSDLGTGIKLVTRKIHSYDSNAKSTIPKYISRIEVSLDARLNFGIKRDYIALFILICFWVFLAYLLKNHWEGYSEPWKRILTRQKSL
jgi:hypothetical protein